MMFVPKILGIYVLVGIAHAQQPDCKLPGNADGYAFLLDAGRLIDLQICDLRTKALIAAPPTAGNAPYVAHNCQYTPDGAPARKVVRRIGVANGTSSEWEVCTNRTMNGQDKFDIKVCQFGQACRLKKDIISLSTIPTTTPSTSCSDLLTNLLNNRRQFLRLFDSTANPCDFSILTPNMVGRDDVAACKYGKYNNVFYELDVPIYCVVNHLGAYKSKCIRIDSLYEALKQFDKKADRKRGAHNPQEYKRYLLQARMKIHTANGADHYNGNAGMHSKSGFTTLFKNAVAQLSSVHPEVHKVNFDDGLSFGADTFCTVALTHFPIDDETLFEKVAFQNCPEKPMILPESITCESDDNRLADLNFPRDINLVWYDENKRPKSCYFPAMDSKSTTQQQCLPFDVAESLLSRKNKDIQGPWSVQRRDYLAGLLRAYNDLQREQPRVAPNAYFWNKLLPGKTPIETILRDIEAALGYTDDPRRRFTITNSKNRPAVGTTIEMSVHAFCAAVLEMVPFKMEELLKSMRSTKKHFVVLKRATSSKFQVARENIKSEL